MRRFAKFAALTILAALLTACGSNSSDSNSGSATTTATGYFVDAPVQGVTYSYVQNGQTITGTTGAGGAFTYPAGVDVTFSVGNLTLGTVTPSGTVTPIHLAGNGANATSPAAINVVRLLLSLNSSGNTNNLIIDPTVAAAATTTLNLATATDLDLQAALNQINAATGNTFALTTVAAAQNHLQATMNGMFAGSYSGTYSGTSGGVWSIVIDASGNVTGSVDTGDVINGTMSTTLNTNGFDFVGTAGNTTWNGTLNTATGTFSGNWSNGTGSGSYTGTKAATGGGGGTPMAQGLWRGTNPNNGNIVDLLVVANGAAWITSNDSFKERPSSLTAGTLLNNAGVLSGTATKTALDVGVPMTGLSVTGTQTPSAVTLTLGGTTLNLTPVATTPATLAAVTRFWTNSWICPVNSDEINTTIDANGQFAVSTMLGKTLAGQLTPSTAGDYFDAVLTFGGTSTLYAGKTFTGIAYLTTTAANTQKLVVVASDGTDYIGFNVQ